MGPGGDSEAFAEMFLGFGLAMLTGVICVYLVLLLLFRSGRRAEATLPVIDEPQPLPLPAAAARVPAADGVQGEA